MLGSYLAARRVVKRPGLSERKIINCRGNVSLTALLFPLSDLSLDGANQPALCYTGFPLSAATNVRNGVQVVRIKHGARVCMTLRSISVDVRGISRSVID